MNCTHPFTFLILIPIDYRYQHCENEILFSYKNPQYLV